MHADDLDARPVDGTEVFRFHLKHGDADDRGAHRNATVGRTPAAQRMPRRSGADGTRDGAEHANVGDRDAVPGAPTGRMGGARCVGTMTSVVVVVVGVLKIVRGAYLLLCEAIGSETVGHYRSRWRSLERRSWASAYRNWKAAGRFL